LGRLAEQVSEVRTRLDWVKLYPPYPPDEPRRAAAIRQFNGIVAEVRRMVDQAEPLSPTASTEQAERAVAVLSRCETLLRDRRERVQAAIAAGSGPSDGEIEAQIAAVRRGLAPIGQVGMAAGSTGLLRELL
jgi:hypothetical protein